MCMCDIIAAMQKNFTIFSGRAHPALAESIAKHLKIPLGKILINTFPDSEIHVQIEESVRGKEIFIIQPTCPPVNENLMELLIMADGLKRNSAGPITAVIPYYGYGRQDRKSTGREPVSARLVANLLQRAGVERVVSVDLHASQIQGFFDVPVDHLTAITTLARHYKTKNIQNAVVVSPDVGRAKLTEKYAAVLGLPMVLMHKRRDGVGGKQIEVAEIIGDVKDKTPIIVDDLIAGGSIIKQARALAKAGAKPVYIAATHGILVGNALELLNENCVEEVAVTDTVPVSEEKQRALPKLKVLSIAPLLAEVIANIHEKKSVSEVFKKFGITFAV